MLAVMPDLVLRLDFVGRVAWKGEMIVTVENMDLETKYGFGKGGERQKEAPLMVCRMQEKKHLQSQLGYVAGSWILWITESVQTWSGPSLSRTGLVVHGGLALLS
jgi:hypothetical protein